MAKTPPATLEVAGREVRVSNPDKVYFPDVGVTKLQLCEYFPAGASPSSWCPTTPPTWSGP